ncbi:MAG: ABC transporter permease [Acidobacteria bacterium]|nr:ABC transporter permease [Acidobacteriota bacterium]
MQTLIQDLRYGARMLLKKPGFTLIAVITLALGIGANTAIFSVVNAVLLRPLPFKEPDRLMTVWSSDLRRGDRQGNVSYPDLIDWRAQNQSFEHLAVFRTRSFALTGSDEPLRLNGAVVSADLFALLGISPSMGRGFRTEEDNPGKRVVVLGHSLWQRRFKSDPQVVGRNITLDEASYTVVGVMPAGFQFPIEAEPVELWTTIAHDAMAPAGGNPMTAQRGLHFLEAIGRLKPRVTVAQAQAEMDVIGRRLEQQYPDSNANRSIRLVPTFEQLVGDVRRPLQVLLGTVLCVLLIACANVTNLMLARATERRREMTIRSALGAGRWRIVRQLLIESILLALTGGLCGWLLAWWGIDLLVGLSPENIPRLQDIRVDSRMFGFTMLVSLLTGIIFGMAPALQATKTELTEALKESGRVSSDGARRTGLRGALIIAEVAIALVLMVGAGLLLSSFWRLLHVNSGFDPHNVLTLRVGLPGRYSDPQAVAFYDQLQSRLQTLPGVRSASACFGVPLSKSHIGTDLEIEGRPSTPADRQHIDCHLILPDYFRALGIRLIKGRDFTARDDLGGRPVVIINEALARRHFPNEDPIGKRVRPDISSGPGDAPMREIIGIIGDVRHSSLTAEVPAEVYMPYPQLTIVSNLALVLRAEADPRDLIGTVRAEVQALDKEVPVYEVKTLDQYLSAVVANPRFNALLITIFAGVALLLTAVGLYGVMSYSVTQRTHEIGIRIALGAQPRDVLKLMAGRGMILTLLGLVIGLAASFALTRLMSGLLYSVSAHDPATYILISLLLLGAALLACYVPARRATKVDPMVALRYE